MDKKKVVIVGNCQSRAISSFFEAINDEIEVTKIAIVHLLTSEQEEEYKPYFEDADYIVTQLVAPNYPCKFVRTEMLDKYYGDKLTKIVNLFCYRDTPYLRNLPRKLRGSEPPYGDYHFPIIFDCWKKGVDIGDASLALEKFNNDFLDEPDIYDELIDREKVVDVPIVDYIKNTKKRLFYTFNHPHNDLLLEYSKRILKHLNLQVLPLDKKTINPMLDQFIPFIKSGEMSEHKLIKDRKVVFTTTKQLITEFYEFYKNNPCSTNIENQENKIPKVIIQYWDGELPDEIKKLTDTWKNTNPDYVYKLFNHKQALHFIKYHYGEKTTELFLKAKIPAMQSDIFRVAYCLAKGGMYIDAATNCNKSLADLFNKKNTLKVMRKWHGGIWNGFILCSSNHPVLKNIWNKIISNLEQEVGNNIWSVTGPGLFNQYCENEANVEIIPQVELSNSFELVNDLKHKKNNHWSEMQKESSIFSSPKNNNMPKVILHLGPHETGCVSFQRVLEQNDSLLKKQNIALVTVRSTFSGMYKELRDDYTRIIQGALLADNSEEVAVKENLAKVFTNLIEAIIRQQPDTQKVLISDENLLGPLVGQYFANQNGREKNIYSLNKLIFESINIAFSSNLEKVILIDSGKENFISSSYKAFINKLIIAENLEAFQEALASDVYDQYDHLYLNAKSSFSEKYEKFNFDFFCKEMVNIINNLLGTSIENNQANKMLYRAPISSRGIEIALKVIPELKSTKEIEQFRHFLKFIN